MYIVLAILLFGILVFVHELGHFMAARACDVKVEEFAIGMGPKILKKQGKETLYSLRLFPFGGFCAMVGEDEEVEDPRSFSSKRPWQKVIILFAGAAMNFIFGFLMILLVFSFTKVATPTITDAYDTCPYIAADKLHEGDLFYKVDGHRIYSRNNFVTFMSRSGDDYHDIVVVRDGEKILFKDFYMPLVEYKMDDGTTELKYGITIAAVQTGVGVTLQYSWYQSIDFVRTVWMSLGDLVTGTVGLRDLSGPVGIVDVVSQAADEAEDTSSAVLYVIYIFALIAVNLAVMNLLPIPALDGGKIFFLIITLIIERITRKKLDPKYEGYINSACFVLLMGLMVVVLFSDVAKIIMR